MKMNAIQIIGNDINGRAIVLMNVKNLKPDGSTDTDFIRYFFYWFDLALE
jgi:hypothetical protein